MSSVLFSTIHTWESSWVALDKLLNWKHWKLPDSERERASSQRVDAVVERMRTFCPTAGSKLKPKTLFVTLQDLVDADIIVVTLSSSRSVSSLLRPGSFTHIILDEAAQALETEAIIPLVLADAKTRVVSFSFTKVSLFPFPLYLNKWSGDYPIFNPCKLSSAPHFIFYDAWPPRGEEGI